MSMRKFVAVMLMALGAGTAHAAETVDRAYLAEFDSQNYPCCGVSLAAFPDSFELSDGSSFSIVEAPHPSSSNGFSKPRVSRVGRRLIYTFESGDVPYSYLEYGYYGTDGHSTSLVLMQPAKFVLVAIEGSSTGVVRGFGLIAANDPLPANPATGSVPENFNYNSAPVGESAYVELQIKLKDAYFTSGLFEQSFNYTVSGLIDFTRTK